MFCDPDKCPNCQYIGEGDSYCDAIGEIVLDDWTPTEYFMGNGCPYLKRKPVSKRKGRKQTKHTPRGGNQNG